MRSPCTRSQLWPAWWILAISVHAWQVFGASWRSGAPVCRHLADCCRHLGTNPLALLQARWRTTATGRRSCRRGTSCSTRTQRGLPSVSSASRAVGRGGGGVGCAWVAAGLNGQAGSRLAAVRGAAARVGACMECTSSLAVPDGDTLYQRAVGSRSCRFVFDSEIRNGELAC